MTEYKNTIRTPVSYTGIGLHTGEISTITFKPARKDEGIVFIRTDLPDKPEIPADIDHVVDISRGTTIGVKDATVATIEHVLAAIKGLSIDNIRIEIDGPEAPVADGSAIVFLNLLKKAGLVQQDAFGERVRHRDRDRCGQRAFENECALMRFAAARALRPMRERSGVEAARVGADGAAELKAVHRSCPPRHNRPVPP